MGPGPVPEPLLEALQGPVVLLLVAIHFGDGAVQQGGVGVVLAEESFFDA